MIGERLYDLRKDSNLTQDELAEILHINKHSISSYERDKSEPPDAVKIAIAKYFNVSVDYLLGLTDAPLPLNKDDRIFRLPASFPKSKLAELKNYIDYLTFKDKATNKNAPK